MGSADLAAIGLTPTAERCAELWTPDGPTRRAIRWAKEGPLTRGQQVMLASAFALWSMVRKPGKEHATLDRLAHTLDQKNLAAVLTLTMACRIGASAVEAWIADPACRHWMPRQHCGSPACNGAEARLDTVHDDVLGCM